ncbi:hypothetical protein AB1Y20_012257 [Prymnesium parvum]|uniref:Trichome birefringence-like C-terminal domain-containing protein n=1 Tax=Prymnesium parvum TaxID=97485 RepID=A0AB34IQQ7_PRYPA
MGSSIFPLLVLFDDSLHNRWVALARRGCNISEAAQPDVGRLSYGQPVLCGRSLRAHFGHRPGAALALLSDEPVVLSNASAPLILSFAFAFSTWPSLDRLAACPAVPTRGECRGAVCVAVRLQTVADAETLFMPLCDAEPWRTGKTAAHAHGRTKAASQLDWRQAQLPLHRLGVAGSLDEILFVAGEEAANLSAASLWVDEVWLGSERAPAAGDAPPSYGRRDINVVRSSWLQGVRMAGSANAGRSNRNPHFCEYMSSELAHAQHVGEARPRCRMDGDHLAGRWMQTCDPRLIRRPDHFAYGRALPAVKGWFDYRLCYRQSATERLRTLQALSWSWRPFRCALVPVNGATFDKWLGKRTMLFLGDSLTAQGYYSLLWLLGDVVVQQEDLFGYTPDEVKKGSKVAELGMDICQSSAGNEGGYISRARLRSGGRMMKVMRHGEIVDELRRATSAFWSRWASDADIIVLNVGHHYHSVDPAFKNYDQLARLGIRQLEKLMKPAAQLIFRTTNIGHHSCETAARPLHSRREAWQQLTGSENIWAWRPKQHAKGSVDMFKDKYNWRGPPLFEASWADAARRSRLMSGRFTFLNVSFMDARADGHVATAMRYSSSRGAFGAKWKTEFPLDCLHYCYPGPSDFWALSLFNLLLNNPRFNA